MMARARRFKRHHFSPEQLLRILWTCVFFGGILTMVIKLFPWFYQQNQVTQALVLPFALVLSLLPSWMARLLIRRPIPGSNPERPAKPVSGGRRNRAS
jgi:hypothetical protein